MRRARLVPADDPRADSAAFFRDRAHVPHLDRPAHRRRLHRAAGLVDALVPAYGIVSVVDLGCGDGGLLSLLRRPPARWGYDVRAASVANARRGVVVEQADFLTEPVELGPAGRNLVVITEVLEHLDDPAGLLDHLAGRVRLLVASSPADEDAHHHNHTHVWAWDEAAYAALFAGSGYSVVHQERVGWSQLLVAEWR